MEESKAAHSYDSMTPARSARCRRGRARVATCDEGVLARRWSCCALPSAPSLLSASGSAFVSSLRAVHGARVGREAVGKPPWPWGPGDLCKHARPLPIETSLRRASLDHWTVQACVAQGGPTCLQLLGAVTMGARGGLARRACAVAPSREQGPCWQRTPRGRVVAARELRMPNGKDGGLSLLACSHTQRILQEHPMEHFHIRPATGSTLYACGLHGCAW